MDYVVYLLCGHVSSERYGNCACARASVKSSSRIKRRRRGVRNMLMRIQCQIAAVLLRSQVSMGTELWLTVFDACETTIL